MALTKRKSSNRGASKPDGNRIRISILVAGIAVSLLLSNISTQTKAAKRNRRGGSSQSRQMSAAKSRMASMIQQQIDAAKKVLAAVESKAAMSQSEVEQALSELSKLRSEMENAELDVRETSKALKEIEEELLNNPPPDSELAKAQAALEQAKNASHLAGHRVLDLPPDEVEKPSSTARLSDLAKLSATQRATLAADASYQSAVQNLRDAGQHLDQVRRKVFQANGDWVAAQQELTEAQQRLRAERQHAKAAGASSTKKKQEIQNAQSLAATARAVIAQGEARLRLLSKMSSGRSKSPRRRQ